MTTTHFTTTERTFKHLTDIKRGRLEETARAVTYTQMEMADELDISQSTISRELKRGRTRQIASNRTYYNRYLADAGSRVYHENRQSSLQRNSHVNLVSIPLSKHIERIIQMNMFLARRPFIH